MNNSEFTKVIYGSSQQEIVARINDNLGQKGNRAELFLLCMVFVVKAKAYITKLHDDIIPEIVSTMFIDVIWESEVTQKELLAMIDKEIWDSYTSFKIQPIDVTLPYGYSYDVNSYSDENEVEMQAMYQLMSDRIMSQVPDRLISILQFYLDTGILAAPLLPLIDKFLLLFYISKLGGTMTVNEDIINQLIPNNPREKALFLSALANNNQALFFLLTLLGDVGKLSILTEVLGGSEIRIPTTTEMVSEVEDLSQSSKNMMTGLDVSPDFMSLFVSDKPESVVLDINLIDYIHRLLSIEATAHEKHLNRIASGYKTSQVFSEIQRELSNSLTILERIKKLSSDLPTR